MIECCTNCEHYELEDGYRYSEHTWDTGGATCWAPGNGQFHKDDSSDKIINKQREVLRDGCTHFKPYK